MAGVGAAGDLGPGARRDDSHDRYGGGIAECSKGADVMSKVKLGTLITGAAGSAQELLITLEPTDPLAWAGTVGTWFINAPGQSPAWQHYFLSCVHLRPMKGVKPANLQFPNATHEFVLMAIALEKLPVPQDPKTWLFLRPINMAEQVVAYDDTHAARILHSCAWEVAYGNLWAEPPLSGQVEPWRKFLRMRSTWT